MTPARHASTLAVIGAGPAGLMAAEVAAAAGARVTVYDRMPSPARKFLLAGRGGLNLTHSEAPDLFMARYGAAREPLLPALSGFGPDALRRWSAALGEPTVVGSSGRVFPQSFKASPLLRAWLRRLDASGVAFTFRHRWTGWTAAGDLGFETPAGAVTARSDATLLALGGASWPRLGSDGGWTDALAAAGITAAPLRPANCGFDVAWSDAFRERGAGQPLKSIAIRFADRTVRGEAVVTRTGIEGGAIYGLSAPLRDAIAAEGRAMVHIALRPDLAPAVLAARLAAQPAKASVSTRLRKGLGLAPVAIGLIQEARHQADGAQGAACAATPEALADLVNAVPLRLHAPRPIAEAISSAGGVRFADLDAAFMLRARPGVFVAGEMIDWEAPTGGYLLQACFATGAAAGAGAVSWLGLTSPAGSPLP